MTHTTAFTVTTGVYKIDKIKTEAREAAGKHTDINAACPYPFGSTAAHIFRTEFEAVRAILVEYETRQYPGLQACQE